VIACFPEILKIYKLLVVIFYTIFAVLAEHWRKVRPAINQYTYQGLRGRSPGSQIDLR
jgi:hypothetical protein